jgi:quinol monooxygenase YgiN
VRHNVAASGSSSALVKGSLRALKPRMPHRATVVRRKLYYAPCMFMLHGRLAARPGKRDDLLAILAEVDHGERLPGCRLYLVAVDETDADGVWVTEVWESEDAHAASLQLDRVKGQVALAMAVLDPAGFKRQQLHARAGIPD